MAQPNSKATLKEYCLRRLGKPVLEINVSDDQCDDAIDYAVQKFQQYHYDGAERVYLKHKFTAAEIAAGKANIAIPKNIAKLEMSLPRSETGVTSP